MGKRKKTHEFSDQYGEARAQDRDEHMGGAGGGRGGGGMTGGGSAGGRGPKTNVSFQRQLPKFLQPYAHMIGKGGPSEDEPLVDGGDNDGEQQQHAKQKMRLGPYGDSDEEEEDDDEGNEVGLDLRYGHVWVGRGFVGAVAGEGGTRGLEEWLEEGEQEELLVAPQPPPTNRPP